MMTVSRNTLARALDEEAGFEFDADRLARFVSDGGRSPRAVCPPDRSTGAASPSVNAVTCAWALAADSPAGQLALVLIVVASATIVPPRVSCNPSTVAVASTPAAVRATVTDVLVATS